MRGLADGEISLKILGSVTPFIGSGADYNTLVRVHMIAGLTQGKCSMFGAWGDAINFNGNVLQLRSLDWNMDGIIITLLLTCDVTRRDVR